MYSLLNVDLHLSEQFSTEIMVHADLGPRFEFQHHLFSTVLSLDLAVPGEDLEGLSFARMVLVVPTLPAGSISLDSCTESPAQLTVPNIPWKVHLELSFIPNPQRKFQKVNLDWCNISLGDSVTYYKKKLPKPEMWSKWCLLDISKMKWLHKSQEDSLIRSCLLLLWISLSLEFIDFFQIICKSPKYCWGCYSALSPTEPKQWDIDLS